MSKEYKNIDELFRQELGEAFVAVPDSVKAGIDKRIGGNKGKSRLLWLIPALLLLIGGAWLGIPYLIEKPATAETDLQITHPENDGFEKINTIEPVDLSDNSDAEITDIQTPDATNEFTDHTSNQYSTTSNSNSGGNTSKNTSGTGVKSNTGNRTNTGASGGSSDGSSYQPVQNESGSTLQVEQSGGGSDQGTGNLTTEYGSDQTGTTGGNQNSGSVQKTDTSSISEHKGPEMALTNEKDSTDNITTTDIIEDTDSTDIAEEEFIDTTNQVDINPEPKEKYNPWMISWTGGMNLVRSDYLSPLAQEQDLYTTSSSDKLGLESNLDVTCRLKNGISIGSGFGIQQLVESYSFFAQSIIVDSSLIWTYVYDSLDSLQMWPIDSSYTATYDTTGTVLYNENGTNKATYIHIPLQVGTQLIFGNKWRLDLFAGVRFNYLVSASGGYIAGGTFMPFTKASGNIYRPWYLDFFLGTNVHYAITKKLYLTGTMRYRPKFGETYSGTSFNRKFQYVHLGLGLSLKL